MVTFGACEVKTFHPWQLNFSATKSKTGTKEKRTSILKSQPNSKPISTTDCYVPLDPYKRTLRQDFCFNNVFPVEFDDEPNSSQYFCSSGLRPPDSVTHSSNESTSEEEFLERFIMETSGPRTMSFPKASFEPSHDMYGFDDMDMRYDEDGELWAVDNDFM